MIGSGIGATIVRSGDLPRDDPGANYTTTTQIRGIGVSNTFVRDLTVKLEGGTEATWEVGISFDEGSSDVGILGVEAVGHEKPALRVTGPASNVRFDGNYVHDTKLHGTGILIDSFSGPINNVSIIRNKVHRITPDSAQGGVSIWVCCQASVSNVAIKDNSIQDTKDGDTEEGGGLGFGIRLYHHTGAGTTADVQITNNVSTGNTAAGLNVTAHQGAVTGLVIKDNILTRNGSGAIQINTDRDTSSWTLGPNMIANVFLPFVQSYKLNIQTSQ